MIQSYMSLDTQIAHFWNLCNDCSDSYEMANKVAKQHILSSNERCEAVLCLAGCLVEMDEIYQSASGESTIMYALEQIAANAPTT